MSTYFTHVGLEQSGFIDFGLNTKRWSDVRVAHSSVPQWYMMRDPIGTACPSGGMRPLLAPDLLGEAVRDDDALENPLLIGVAGDDCPDDVGGDVDIVALSVPTRFGARHSVQWMDVASSRRDPTKDFGREPELAQAQRAWGEHKEKPGRPGRNAQNRAKWAVACLRADASQHRRRPQWAVDYPNPSGKEDVNPPTYTTEPNGNNKVEVDEPDVKLRATVPLSKLAPLDQLKAHTKKTQHNSDAVQTQLPRQTQPTTQPPSKSTHDNNCRDNYGDNDSDTANNTAWKNVVERTQKWTNGVEDRSGTNSDNDNDNEVNEYHNDKDDNAVDERRTTNDKRQTTKDEGRPTKDEGRRTKDDRRRTKDEGRTTNDNKQTKTTNDNKQTKSKSNQKSNLKSNEVGASFLASIL